MVRLLLLNSPCAYNGDGQKPLDELLVCGGDSVQAVKEDEIRSNRFGETLENQVLKLHAAESPQALFQGRPVSLVCRLQFDL